eukprot:280952_1
MMETVGTLKLLRSIEKQIVHRYFNSNFIKQAPTDIINLCICYCFILDEFHNPSKNTDIIIKGINNTITTITSTVNQTTVTSRNKISCEGKYHWVFQLSSLKNAELRFGFFQNNEHVELYYLTPSEHWNTETDTLHVYLDSDNNTVTYNIQDNDSNNYSSTETYFTVNECQLAITINKGTAIIKMLGFNNSNWYKTGLQSSDAMSHIHYAECTAKMSEKLKHYCIALKLSPHIELWNNKYLSYLIVEKKYDIAYQHSIKYAKANKAMVQLICMYYDKDEITKAHNLLKLFTDIQLKKFDLYFKSGYCFSAICEKH